MFAEKTGFDPRDDGDAYRYYWVRPVEVRAWREVDEVRSRLIMREGRWL